MKKEKKLLKKIEKSDLQWRENYIKILKTYIKSKKKRNEFNLFYGQIWAMRGNYTQKIEVYKQPLHKLVKLFIQRDIVINSFCMINHSTGYCFKCDGSYGIEQTEKPNKKWSKSIKGSK